MLRQDATATQNTPPDAATTISCLSAMVAQYYVSVDHKQLAAIVLGSIKRRIGYMLLLDGCCVLTTEPSHHEGRDARHGQHSGGGTRASAGADIKRREFIASLITSNSSEEALHLGPTRAIYYLQYQAV
jgi:hypothetical protein